MENRARLWKLLSDEGIKKKSFKYYYLIRKCCFFLNLFIEVNQVQMLKGVIK